MTRSSLSFASLALLATMSCSQVLPPLTPPEDGGPPWHELVSKHIILRTDRSEDEAREALEDLEQMYSALHDIAFSQINVEGSRIVVVHFDRQRDFERFAPANTAGVFANKLPNDLDSEPTMLVWGKLDVSARGTLQHELSHMFIRTGLAGAPPWLNEGLAEYYETLAVENGSAFVGRPLLKMRAWTERRWITQRISAYETMMVPVNLLPSVNDLIRMDAGKFYVWTDKGRQPTLDEAREQMTHYLAAYGLVHMMMHTPEYQAKYDEMMELIARGMTARQAWAKTFASVDADKLETDFRQHLLNKYETMVLKTAYAQPAVKPEAERKMEPGEVHLLWARMRPWGGAELAAAQADMDAARRQSKSPEVSFYSGLLRAAQGDLPGAEKDIHAALDAKPDDPRYLHALVSVYRKMPDAASNPKLQAAVEKLAKAAASGRALETISEIRAAAGKWDDALGFAQRSVKSDPTCSSCYRELAAVFFEKKQYGDAAAAQQISLSLLPDGLQDPEGEAKLRMYLDAQLHAPVEAPAPPPAAPPAPSAAP